MSFHISIIGIDGSGKSTVTPALANLIAAEFGLTTIAIGDDYRGQSPQEALFQPDFMPDGKLFTMRLGQLFRRGAKATTANRRLYPFFKLAQLVLQERIARKLATTHQPDVVFSDGNLILSSAGRAINYVHSAPGSVFKEAAGSAQSYVQALYDYVFTGTPLPLQLAQPIPGLKLMRWLRWFDQKFKLDILRLPDAIIFLDIAPEAALARLKRKGETLDDHENLYDLSQAQAMYGGVVDFFRQSQGDKNVAVIDVTALSTGQILQAIVDFAQKLPLSKKIEQTEQELLGTNDEALTKTSTVLKKVLSYRYLVRYTLCHIRQGSLHEITFPLSNLGRFFLKEGYSAKVMRTIYLQKRKKHNLLDRIFLSYPLHRAVNHRLQNLDLSVEREFRKRIPRLSHDKQIKVLTAPSGYALDLFQPLRQLNLSNIATLTPVHIFASDLDPTGDIESSLTQTASKLGVTFDFWPGDLTSSKTQETFKQAGPYDMIFFVGLSSWISKMHLINHLKLIRRSLLAPDGVLFIDCFNPKAYALSGKYIGYQANYYNQQEFSHILDYCGFDPANMIWLSESEGINHVCIAHSTPLNQVIEPNIVSDVKQSVAPFLQPVSI